MRRAVLGIDAAWTVREPSGVALVAECPGGWEAVAVAPSYRAFLGLAKGMPVDWSVRHRGETPDPAALVEAGRALLGKSARISVVAIDIPFSRVEIEGRREADNRISRVFGGRHCGTHSPGPERPGPVSIELRDGFERLGFRLATGGAKKRPGRALIEVYPHPALLTLMGVEERFRYKLGRRAKLWPDLSTAQRLDAAVKAFGEIRSALSRRIRMDGCEIPLPLEGGDRRPSRLKAFEDSIDALISAWVGIAYLEGTAVSYGDEDAAIWVPG